MNESRSKCCYGTYAVAIIGTFLIAAGLVWLMRSYTRVEPIGHQKAEERRQNLAAMKAENAQLLGSYAWHDQGKGIVRLPIDRAKELTIQEWKNPQAGRATLVKRVEKASAPAPKAPEKPSEYE